ncbi:unnamed protein product, partial [Prorocentrum cordatum]
RPFWETREAPVWAQHMFQRQGLAVQEHKRATMHYNLGLGKPRGTDTSTPQTFPGVRSDQSFEPNPTAATRASEEAEKGKRTKGSGFGTLSSSDRLAYLREACRPRAARRTPRPVGGRDACKLPWEGSLWKGVRPGPKRASEGLNLQEEEEEEEAGRGTQNDCEDDPRRELARP